MLARCAAGPTPGFGAINRTALLTTQVFLQGRKNFGHTSVFGRKRHMATDIDQAIGKLDGLIVQASASSAPADQSEPLDSGAMQAPTDRVMSIADEMRAVFATAIEQAYPGMGVVPSVSTSNPKFSDYQCNNAMALHGKLKGKENAPKNPRSVGEAIDAALPVHPAIASTSLAGPGFINVKLSEEWMAKRIDAMLINGIGTWAPSLPDRRVAVDFSSPNVAKEMHVGHLRSTILGDTLCRILQFCGCDVLRLNHVGDWGTQFGMLIQHMAELHEGGLAAVGDEDISDLLVLYKASKKRFDEEEDFKRRAREAVTRLQSGEPAVLAAWEKLCDTSREEFDAIYQRLDIQLTWRGESFYNPMLPSVVKDLVDRGIAEDSNGALCVFIEGEQAPLMVRKSDGGYGYGTTDMAAITHRVQTEKVDWAIYVTDCSQADHFKMVFAAARRAGILPTDPATRPRVSHVGFGLVLGDDGKRFRTRSSEVTRLVDLLDEAKRRCQTTIKARREERGEPISDQELEEASNAMGYGAVKYADLKNQRLTNYRFDFDAMLSLKGNTAVYLLYAHARIAGIVRKSGRDISELAKSAKLVIGNDKERMLAVHILRFPEALADVVEDLAPNRLTEYLYELTDIFNSFYVEHKVLGSPEEESRLLLVEATAVVIRQCFSMLGITPLYRI